MEGQQQLPQSKVQASVYVCMFELHMRAKNTSVQNIGEA
jgi:hypothetical protein